MKNNSSVDNILESLNGFFGSLESPDFSKIQEVYEREPHRKLISELSRCFRVENVTDLNTDVAVVLSLISLEDEARTLRIELSLIDRFVALFLIENNKSTVLTDNDKELSQAQKHILRLLESENYILLSKDTMSTQIDFNRPNSNGRSSVYNALFSDADIVLN